MIDRHDSNLLLDYLEGELPDAVAAEVESAMANDEELRRLIAELSADRDALRAMPEAEPPGELIEAIQAQLEREMLLGAPPEPIPLARGHRNTQPPAANQPSHLRARLMFLGGIAALLALAAGITLYSLSQTTLLNLAGSNPATTPDSEPMTESIAQRQPAPDDAPIALPDRHLAGLDTPAHRSRYASIPEVSDPSTAAWFISNASPLGLDETTLDDAYRLALSPPHRSTNLTLGIPPAPAFDAEFAGAADRAFRAASADTHPESALREEHLLGVVGERRFAAVSSEASDSRPQAANQFTPLFEQQLVVASRDGTSVESELRQWAQSNRVSLIQIDRSEPPAAIESTALPVPSTTTGWETPETAEAALGRSMPEPAAAAPSVSRRSTRAASATPQKIVPRPQTSAPAEPEAAPPAPAAPQQPPPDAPPRRLLLQVNTAQLPELIGELQSPGRALRLQQNIAPNRVSPASATLDLATQSAILTRGLPIPQRFPLSPAPLPATLDQLVQQDAVDWIEVQIRDNP
ncbi:MAG: hypothetical protein AAF797_05355 [Planctomycetota bacterium]